jgi:hypothetical protein
MLAIDCTDRERYFFTIGTIRTDTVYCWAEKVKQSLPCRLVDKKTEEHIKCFFDLTFSIFHLKPLSENSPAEMVWIILNLSK